MKITTLLENTAGMEGCRIEHGLSMLIETANHRILLDSGASDAYHFNAELLGADLKAVDTMILSHGHSDHSGGIADFHTLNPSCPIYMQKTAGGAYYRKDPGIPGRYIGIDPAILQYPELVLLEGDARINDECSVYAHITGRRLYSESNRPLARLVDGEYVEDSFDHEQCLVVEAEGKRCLFSGCAHNGMLNILDRYREIYGGDPDYVFSGFHFHKQSEYTAEEIRIIRETAEELASMHTIFYTGHCTSLPGFLLMKPIMGDKLRMLQTGTVIEL